MKWFGRKGAARAGDASGARPVLARGWSWNGGGELPRSYEERVREGYLGNPVAQRAVKLVAEGVAAAPVSASEPAAAALIARRTGGQPLIETIAMQLLLHGNAFVRVLGGEAGPAAFVAESSAPADAGRPEAEDRGLELYALRPERVAVERDARGWPASYLYTAGEAAQRIAGEDALGRPAVVHLRSPHPLDDHYGLGCLGAAAGAIAIHNAATRWNKALLDNAARPSGALVFEGAEPGATLSPDQFERLREELDGGFAGAANAGRPMLLEGGLRWQAMSLTPADMDFVGLKAAAAREIALAFGVPPMLLGLPGDAAYANYREANKALWRTGVLPLAGAILSGLADALGAWWPGLTLAVDLDRVPALAEERERLWASVTAADFLSRGEKRALLGVA